MSKFFPKVILEQVCPPSCIQINSKLNSLNRLFKQSLTNIITNSPKKFKMTPCLTTCPTPYFVNYMFCKLSFD